ncbi:hypothetical protein EVJ50_06815 [Synechococcus sp. RSCCF101]|uniref:hypothetical protein n=1 Tax=Synechococcus sp. RSCCF101 TaxID=2511069 RepID=UPI001245294E|nr:hypothetical protein [Synechococcus sp. RSCCF101]QEY31992.1 hypothetical protein EVJ50_06815 [Synechococcus sp. RSCCF101]
MATAPPANRTGCRADSRVFISHQSFCSGVLDAARLLAAYLHHPENAADLDLKQQITDPGRDFPALYT